MATYEIFQVDAFADRVFAGNPAAIVPLAEWLPDEVLQSIALENNLSETAFYVTGDRAGDRTGNPAGDGAGNDGFELRWFTPQVEVDLCGHATLAAAYVVFERGDSSQTEIVFITRSGALRVGRDADRLVMTLPARPPARVAPDPAVAAALGAEPVELHAARDLMAVFANRRDVEALAPDFARLAALDTYAVIATAPGDDCDFVSRFFAPGAGIPEDPVTGSAHCTLVPYWSRRLEKQTLHARQVSARGGTLFCRDHGDRIELSGRVVPYLHGELTL